MYNNGKGVSQSYQEAAKWFRKAAEQGDANAQGLLGEMYYDGKGVSKNFVMSYMFAALSAAQGEEAGITLRDLVLKYLTGQQIAEAQRMATEWSMGIPLPSDQD